MLSASVDKLWSMDHIYKTSFWSDACSYTSHDFKGQNDEKAIDRRQSQNRNPEKGQTIHKDEEYQKATRHRKYLHCTGDVQKFERQAYYSYIKNILEVNADHDDKPLKQKRLWSYIRSVRKDNTGILPVKDKGRLFKALKDKANILNRQYLPTFTQEDTNLVPSPSGIPYPNKEDIEVDEAGIRKLLQKNSPRKALGPDSIPARILKDCSSELAPILTIIFIKSL